MKKSLYWLSLLLLLFLAPALSWAAPPLPANIYGTVTVDGVSIAYNDDYTVEVTKEDGTAYVPVAEDINGFNEGYSVNIPKYDEIDQPGGAVTGEAARIHLYYGDTELTITTPANGLIPGGVGDDFSQTEINIIANSGPRTLTIQTSVNGSTTPVAGSYSYSYNSVVPLTATPDSGYVFSSWTGDVANSSSATTTITMDDDYTISASFSSCSYTLTMGVNDAQMGSVTPDIGDHDRACDSDVNITAIPDEGYYFSNWTGDVANLNNATTTVTMDSDQEVTANFVAVSYTLTIARNNTHGTTNPAPGDHEYGEDAVVSITATPDSGYVFSSWTGDVANSSNATTTVTMDTDQEVTANFEEDNEGTGAGGGEGGGGGGGGIFGEISVRDLLGYHFDGKNSEGVRVYMPVTNAYKALKGAQTHVEGFAPNIALFVRSGFDMLEQKAENNKDGLLYFVGTHSFPVFGKIAECYLDVVNAEKLKVDAYADTTISIEEFKILEQQGKAVAPHRVNFEKETDTVPIHK